jgi:flagellin FlaB
VKKMKNQKETKQDELAAIGIGAMIVFIALILVAAVAAAVIIQTAEKLQQNAQASGDDTQEQMSTKVTLINIVIEASSAGPPANHDLFVTFELAPGSEPTPSNLVGYTVICANAAGTATVFAQGNLQGATVHTGNGAGAAAITLNPGATYIFVMGIDVCPPVSNADHVLILSVTGGGATYEELQYGSSPSVGDVVV